jgi:hypothetical protein
MEFFSHHSLTLFQLSDVLLITTLSAPWYIGSRNPQKSI